MTNANQLPRDGSKPREDSSTSEGKLNSPVSVRLCLRRVTCLCLPTVTKLIIQFKLYIEDLHYALVKQSIARPIAKSRLVPSDTCNFYGFTSHPHREMRHLATLEEPRKTGMMDGIKSLNAWS